MSTVHISRSFSQNIQSTSNGNIPPTTQPVLALKELVARLHQEQYKVQNLLTSLGFALRSFNNLNQFLELIPLMAARVADAEGSILVQMTTEGQIHCEHVYCQDNQSCQSFRQVTEAAIEQVMRKGVLAEERIGWQNKPLPPRLNANKKNGAKGHRLGEYLSVCLEKQIKQRMGKGVRIFGTPILVQGVERGRLYIISQDPQYDWNGTRAKLVQLVADQTAVAIANNELTIELRKKERLDRELEIASEIQLHLLPRKCPQIQGLDLAADCRTASRVGGDYYDFIPTDYDRRQGDRRDGEGRNVPWSIVIGDVMGKGVPAGLIMTMTRGMLRAEVLNRHTPAQILEHLNRVMYADLENSHRFVTLFYSEYDPKTQVLSFSNAAHNPPFWWQAQTQKLQRLDAMGMLVGLEADSAYEDNQVQLADGDTVMYYTDGFTDAVNQDGERFDEGNLNTAFRQACQQYDSSQEILDHLFETIENFIGTGKRNLDDMTLVILRVKSSQSDIQCFE
jgi:sigma-B regulation protein RsbU (phosphoserine phosphatase)